MKKIQIGRSIVYYQEIIHKKDFIKLYQEEVPKQKLILKITTNTLRPFIIIPSKKRKLINLNKDNIITLRLSKGNKKCQLVTKVYKWGKINIPLKVIKQIKIKNHEKINFEIINKNQEIKSINKKGIIDLYQLNDNNIKIIPRAKNYITIYSKQKTPITLPRFIKITPSMIELIFLVHGDGHYQYKLNFTNKAPELHNFVLDKFEKHLRIPRELWKARVLLSNLEFCDNAKKYWENKVKISKNKFYNASKSGFNTDNRGNLRIIIDQTIISIIFKHILKNLHSLKKREIYML